jgi:hypothetical protein
MPAMNTHPADSPLNSARQDLMATLRQTVGSFLGTGLSHSTSDLKPILAGIFAAGLYALLPLLQMSIVPSSRELILLSWWGAIYFGIVVALTRSTSLAVLEIVELLILPNISENFAKSAQAEIIERFVRRKTMRNSLVAASLGILISCLILHGRFSWPSLGIWGLGFFILYFTASQATLTASFYTCFSHSFRKHGDELFPMDPAASPSLTACTRLARRILYYWFLVFLLVMSLLAVPELLTVPLASKFLTKPAAADISLFISTVVCIAGFFSFIFGSLVYLGFESDVRIEVERVRLKTLSTLQGQYRDQADKQTALSTEEATRLDRFRPHQTI